MDRPKLTLVLTWLAIAALSNGAWAPRALAQTDDRRRPSCVTKRGDPCCLPGQRADDDQGVEDDCPPRGRRHRDGGDGRDQETEEVRASDDEGSEGDPARDTGDDGHDDGNDTGPSSSRRGSGRAGASSGKAPRGASANPTPGGATAGGAPSGLPVGSGGPGGAGGGVSGVGPVSTPGAAPGGAAGGAPVAAPGQAAVSSPGVRVPAAPPPTTAAAGSVSSARSGRADAGEANRSLADTGADVATPLTLAMTLLMVGTTLRRTTRPRPARSGSRRPRPPAPPAAAPGWSYVDHSSTARAIEKF